MKMMQKISKNSINHNHDVEKKQLWKGTFPLHLQQIANQYLLGS